MSFFSFFSLCHLCQVYYLLFCHIIPPELIVQSVFASLAAQWPEVSVSDTYAIHKEVLGRNVSKPQARPKLLRWESIKQVKSSHCSGQVVQHSQDVQSVYTFKSVKKQQSWTAKFYFPHWWKWIESGALKYIIQQLLVSYQLSDIYVPLDESVCWMKL